MRDRHGKYPLTQQELSALLHYDPVTGIFTWRMKRRRATAGWKHSKGYVCIDIYGSKFYAHRLAWLFMTGQWPTQQIDHIDFDKSNNAWANLREATPSQNQRYQPVSKGSTTGLKGAYPAFGRYKDGIRPTGSYYSQISIGGKRVHLGTFKTPDEAHAAYSRAAHEFYGAFAKA